MVTSIANVPRVTTLLSWNPISGLYPRQLKESQVCGFDIIEGLLVDDGPKPAGASRKESKPFRFFIPRGANLNSLANLVWDLVDTNQNMVDVMLQPKW